jgi:hypothetical protein
MKREIVLYLNEIDYNKSYIKDENKMKDFFVFFVFVIIIYKNKLK